jgi:hypothetical protein
LNARAKVFSELGIANFIASQVPPDNSLATINWYHLLPENQKKALQSHLLEAYNNWFNQLPQDLRDLDFAPMPIVAVLTANFEGWTYNWQGYGDAWYYTWGFDATQSIVPNTGTWTYTIDIEWYGPNMPIGQPYYNYKGWYKGTDPTIPKSITFYGGCDWKAVRCAQNTFVSATLTITDQLNNASAPTTIYPITPPPPQTPQLLTPADDATSTVGKTVVFSWTPVLGAKRYVGEWEARVPWGWTVKDHITVSGTSFAIKPSFTAELRWHVRTTTNPVWSPYRYFTIVR